MEAAEIATTSISFFLRLCGLWRHRLDWLCSRSHCRAHRVGARQGPVGRLAVRPAERRLTERARIGMMAPGEEGNPRRQIFGVAGAHVARERPDPIEIAEVSKVVVDLNHTPIAHSRFPSLIVFKPYASIGTNLLFFEKGEPTWCGRSSFKRSPDKARIAFRERQRQIAPCRRMP